MSKFNFHSKHLDSYQKLYGLIGFPLSHSFSKGYFAEKFLREAIDDSCYELFPLETIDSFPALIESFPNLRGINVTIPYKEKVLPFLDEIDPSAQGIGAVNTILISGKKLTGFNTDIFGFSRSLFEFFKNNKREVTGALVLGTGGASKAVAYVLETNSIPYQLVSRTPGKGNLTYGDISSETLETYPLIINTTPLGMNPASNTCPDLPYQLLTNKNTLYDLVYNPEKTLFLTKGAAKGCPTINGLEMLHLQAEESWRIWNHEH